MGIILIRKRYNSNTKRYQINKIENPRRKEELLGLQLCLLFSTMSITTI